MALRPRGRQLTDKEVLQFRKLYYQEEWSYKRISEEHDVSYKLVEKAIQGRGSYSGIQDNISDQVKQNRIPARQKYSIKRLKAEYKTHEIVNGKRQQIPNLYRVGWSPEQIERAKESERIAYERAKKFGF